MKKVFLLLGLLSTPAWCDVSLVQITSSTVASSTFTTLTFANTVATGNTIIVFKREGSVAIPTDTVTDTFGNSYSLLVATAANLGGASTCDFIAYYSTNVTGGSSLRVNAASNQGASTSQLIIAEVSGLINPSFDVSVTTASGTNSPTSITAGPSATTAQANEYIVLGGCTAGASVNYSTTAAYTLQNCTAGAACRTFYADRVVGAIGAYSGQITQSSALNIAVSLITFKMTTRAPSASKGLTIQGGKMAITGGKVNVY